MEKLSISIVILTYNEEKNLSDCLLSLKKLNADVLVVDSFSNDKTLDILKEQQIPFLQHEFINYGIQRNWAQSKIKTEWVLHLDADERLTPEFISWYNHSFYEESSTCDGFLFSRRTLFMNRWIRHGGLYPNFHFRLFKASFAKCEEKAYDQHFIYSGSGRIKVVEKADIVNVVNEGLMVFIDKHNRWSTLEAREIVTAGKIHSESVKEKLWGTPIERRRWLKSRIYMKTPLFFRPFFYFIYRYVFRFGILDGIPGLIFHFLHGFWFRFLIDAKIYEIEKFAKENNKFIK